MILAGTTGERGRRIAIVGLTERNLEHLRRGRPAVTELDRLLGRPVDLAIMYGATHFEIVRTLQEAQIEPPAIPVLEEVLEKVDVDLEYDVAVDGGIEGESTRDPHAALSRALQAKLDNLDSVVTVVLSRAGQSV